MSTEAPERTGFDRREALKKAALAGGIVWAAPLIASSPAFAVSACTPKCVPGNFTPTVEVTEFCGGTSGGAKWAELTFTLPGGGICPCTGDPGTVNATPPAAGWTGNAVTASSSGNTIVVKGPGNGSLSDGQYCTVDTLNVSITCLDKSGDSVTRRCTYTLCFDFSPSGGAVCVGGVAGNATATLVGCELLCPADG